MGALHEGRRWHWQRRAPRRGGAPDESPNDWSPDGRFILYVIGRARATGTSWRCRWRATESQYPVVATPFNETNAQFSHDGRWIAFQSNESGQPEIYVQPFLRPGQKVRISTEGGIQARWRSDGKELFYLAPDQRLMAVPIQLDAQRNVVDVGTPAALFRLLSRASRRMIAADTTWCRAMVSAFSWIHSEKSPSPSRLS